MNAKKKIDRLIVIGNPNVGKSVLFNRLTGSYATVSNYPGTTVEVSRGQMDLGGSSCEVIDTPGMYTLMPISEEEKVARDILISSSSALVLHVVDAKNLERMLPLTLELIDNHVPLLLALNMMDEAENAGVDIDLRLLEDELGIPVLGIVATTGAGVEALKKKIKQYV
jgi:ferrous iron transport protein B